MKGKNRLMFHWKQIAGLLCLFTYLFGAAKILPGLVAAAAALEGSHTVQTSDTGATCRVVLHHEARSGDIQAPHRHGPVAKFFCLIAARDDYDPDHVLQIAASGACEKSEMEGLVKPGEHASVYDGNFLPVQFAPACAVQQVSPACFSFGRHPPPRESGHLSALRATVLLV